MIQALIFILVLCFLVVIHELGHYLAALVARVEVEEFGLGLPPRAKQLGKKWGTIWSLNWIPLGGFVKLMGEDQLPTDWVAEKLPRQTWGPYYAKPAQWRLLIILAGPIVNLLFGVLAFTLVYAKTGIPEPRTEARIAEVQAGSPAADSKLPTSVVIKQIKIGETSLSQPTAQQVIDLIQQHRGQTAQITTSGFCEKEQCATEGEGTHQVYIRTPDETPVGQGAMGVSFDPVIFKHYPWYEMPWRASWHGLQQALWLSSQILLLLKQLIVGWITQGQGAGAASELSGPVGIFVQAKESKVFQQGWEMVLYLAGLISINLGIMNLLPIPALDGGRALFIGLEQLIGRKRVAAVESYAHYGGYIFLMALLIIITVRDVVKVIYG